MADEQDQSQKTEQPTHKRLEEAFKRGQIAASREVNNFLILGVLAIIAVWMLPGMLGNIRVMLVPFFSEFDAMPVDRGGLAQIFKTVMLQAAAVMTLPLLLAIAAAFAAGFLQNGFVFSSESIMPRLEKISVFKGLKRLFSLRSLTEFLKGIIKLIIIGSIAVIAISPKLTQLRQLPSSDAEALLYYLASLTLRVMVGVCVAMFFIALLDYMYQRFEYIRSLKMSKQEIKDEFKQQEGDPMIKQRLRSLRMEKARRRMMAAVPKADVVITNPTHFAVALKYDAKTMMAPSVVAKGQDLIALKIREVAQKSGVPIVENAPLAQALYKSTKLDSEIPLHHYKAVAEIIAYVYKLKNKKV